MKTNPPSAQETLAEIDRLFRTYVECASPPTDGTVDRVLSEIGRLLKAHRKNSPVNHLNSALTIASWHLGDGDECGEISRELFESIQKSHPDIFESWEANQSLPHPQSP